MDTQNSKIDQAVLALPWLNLETTGIAWKGSDWDAMERLHQRGLISNPIGKTKSVLLTAEGLAESERLFHELFVPPSSLAE